MAEWVHRYARINGIRMHYVEQGAGMPVILSHGFPHLWFSWRHQVPVIAQAGFRPVAPDMRGMGQTDAPADVAAYDVPQITGDLLGLLDAIDEERAVFVGLDFGAFAVYDLAFRAPERVVAVIGLENPAAPHNPAMPPLAEYAEMAKNHFVHIHYFAPHGPADTALDAAPREFLGKVFYALSGDYHYLDVWKQPPGRLPGCAARAAAAALALAQRARTRVLRVGVRAQRLHRWSQLLPLDGSQVGEPQALRRPHLARAGLFHRQRARLRPGGLSRAGSDLAVPRAVSGSTPRRDDRRRRPPDADGAPARGQCVAARIPEGDQRVVTLRLV